MWVTWLESRYPLGCSSGRDYARKGEWARAGQSCSEGSSPDGNSLSLPSGGSMSSRRGAP